MSFRPPNIDMFPGVDALQSGPNGKTYDTSNDTISDELILGDDSTLFENIDKNVLKICYYNYLKFRNPFEAVDTTTENRDALMFWAIAPVLFKKLSVSPTHSMPRFPEMPIVIPANTIRKPATDPKGIDYIPEAQFILYPTPFETSAIPFRITPFPREDITSRSTYARVHSLNIQEDTIQAAFDKYLKIFGPSSNDTYSNEIDEKERRYLLDPNVKKVTDALISFLSSDLDY